MIVEGKCRKISGYFGNQNSRTHGEGHGKLRTPEYVSWSQMKQRCYNKKATDYEHYGGRGIKVCLRWKNSYETFLSDMGRKSDKDLSLDRINVNGNYRPSNCRWATPIQQGRNRRNSL